MKKLKKDTKFMDKKGGFKFDNLFNKNSKP